MVISAITDGLGNQMFQYACGRAVAKRKNTSFKLDISWFENIDERFTKRSYFLNRLNILEDIALPQEVKAIKNPVYPLIINSLYWRFQYFRPYFKRHFFKEAGFNYDKNVFKTPADVYLQGFFQSPEYFKNIREELIREFTPKKIPDTVLQKAREIKAASNAVSLHVRRGDYLQIGNAQYVLDLGYYTNALNIVKSGNVNLKVYVFSDEPAWVYDNLKLNAEMEVLNLEGATAEHDIYLMSLCRHNIIANSSFSWWGGWLNNNKGSTIIAPKNWFKDASRDTSDLIPNEWIKI